MRLSHYTFCLSLVYRPPLNLRLLIPDLLVFSIPITNRLHSFISLILHFSFISFSSWSPSLTLLHLSCLSHLIHFSSLIFLTHVSSYFFIHTSLNFLIHLFPCNLLIHLSPPLFNYTSHFSTAHHIFPYSPILESKERLNNQHRCLGTRTPPTMSSAAIKAAHLQRFFGFKFPLRR